MNSSTATAISPTWNGDVIGKEQNKDGSNHTSQIALIRKLYDAMGNVNIFKSLLADDVEWDIEEGFPNGGVYRGIAGVFDFFTFTADFDEFYAKGDEYFESGDHVIVLGRYFGVTKKGRKAQSRFAHFW